MGFNTEDKIEFDTETKIFDTETNLFEERIRIEYRRLELRLEQLKKKRSWQTLLILGVLIAVVISVTIFLAIADAWYYKDYKYMVPEAVISVAMGVVFASLGTFCWSMFIETEENRISRMMLGYEIDTIQSELEEDIFENSIKMSYKYLDQYYDQTKDQARRGFKVTVYVACFGALLIGVGIIAMFSGKTNPAYITCAAGVITEFIATVFFYLYNKTITSMSKYHNKLVLSQNISIALKIADSLPSTDNAAAKNKIIEELLKDINNHLVKEDGAEGQT